MSENIICMNIYMQAKEKLEKELEENKSDKSFAEPILNYLLKRCSEDNGLCEDILQAHKAWKKCLSYIYDKARELAGKANSCAVRDDVVYEWAEDYYRKDDKAEEEEKARKEAERKANIEKMAAERKARKTTSKPNSTVSTPATTSALPQTTAPAPEKPKEPVVTQMSLFDFL